MATRAERLQAISGKIDTAKGELQDLVDEYQGWYDNLPESLQGSSTGERLTETIDILEGLVGDLENTAGELDGVDLPRGFGRD